MRILKEDCCGLIIDIQERLLPHIHGNERLLDNTQTLINGLQALNIPLVITEQYTKGLGFTVNPIKNILATNAPIEKISFSCCDEPQFESSLRKLNKKFVIISGIETHVCVLQTALDLLDKGYIPVIVEDCVSSRKLNDKEVALQRISASGGIISTYESILFELCRFAGNDTFKAISKLVK
jgi:nicotinamidase-related amidase